MQLIHNYYHVFEKSSQSRAFCIRGKDFTYGEFLQFIEGSRSLLAKMKDHTNSPVGVLCFDSIETYAAIFAAWLSGSAFVPVNPKHPAERNNEIIRDTGIRKVFSAKEKIDHILDTKNVDLLMNAGLKSHTLTPPKIKVENPLMYILTTSGSTGVPKYVPIRHDNVEAYCKGFLKLFPDLNSEACFLQTYELTSDAAFTGYLLPLLAGACVYTAPDDQFKFLSIAKILTDKRINWVKLTPSVLNYLSAYISKLDLTHIKHFIFGGEALPASLVKLWKPAFPNAIISNLYGPTETTISSHVYQFKDIENARAMNNVLSIGKPFPEVDCIIINENSEILEDDCPGELCIGGKQTMSGYLKGDLDPFVKANFEGRERKFYRTGDLALKDKDGWYYFLGRKDDQVKINGYRVSLKEIEKTIKDMIPGNNVLAVTLEKVPGFKRIFIFVEEYAGDTGALKQGLVKKLPPQMIPDEIIPTRQFPFTASGKIDRQKIISQYL